MNERDLAQAWEWVRGLATNEAERHHVHVIEEALATYDPNCGARTVRSLSVLKRVAHEKEGGAS
jgi:hypothetical protein